jgi:hypothetical protein
MLRKSSLRRCGVVTFEVLLLLAVSFLSLADPACRDCPAPLTAAGYCYAVSLAAVECIGPMVIRRLLVLT